MAERRHAHLGSEDRRANSGIRVVETSLSRLQLRKLFQRQANVEQISRVFICAFGFFHVLLLFERPPAAPEPRTHGDTLRGWQRTNVACQDRTACESLLSDLDPASRACSCLRQALVGRGLSLRSPRHLSSAE